MNFAMTLPNDLSRILNNLDKPILIAISGIRGAGKSTLAAKLGEIVDAHVISIDEFQKSGVFDASYAMWEIMDFARLESEVLIPYQAGRPAVYGIAHPSTGKIESTKTVPEGKKVIIEGVGIFRPELMKYFDYTIWIDCPTNVAIQRGKDRDRYVHHNPNDKLWDTIWKKNDQEYIESYDPKNNADYILENY